MSTNTIQPTKVITGKCRLSYSHVWDAVSIDGNSEPKFGACIIIPKSDKVTLKKIKAAVEAAVAGKTDQMVALDCVRDTAGYHCQTKLVPLTQAANTERKVPREWINAAGNGVEQPFIDYALPLIQGEAPRPLLHGLPRFAKLKKVLTTDMD